MDKLKIEDPRVRKGRWIYAATEPVGWFLITWRADQLDPDGLWQVSLNGRGPAYLLRFAPGAEVHISDTTPPSR